MRYRMCLAGVALLVQFVCPARAQPPGSGGIERATYRARLGDSALRVDATLQVVRPARADASVRLLPASFPLIGALPRVAGARVVLREGSYWLQMRPASAGGPTEAEIRLAFRVAVRRPPEGSGVRRLGRVPAEVARELATSRELRWCTLPIVPATRVLVDLPGELHELRASPKAPVEREAGRLLLYAPPRPMLLLRWLSVPPAKAVAPAFRVDADANVSVAATSVTAATTLEVEVLQGELRALQLTLPEGSQLRSIGGAAVKRWELADGKVSVALRAPVSTRTKLLVRCEMLAEREHQFTWRPVEVARARHQGGTAYFRATPGLLLRAVGREGFERVSDGYAPDEAAGRQTLVLAYPRLPASVRLGVERLRPRVTASVAVLAQLERGVVTQRATIDYAIHDVGVRRFQVRVGEGADVLEVACPGLLDHEVAQGVLTVRLRRAVKDKVQLRLVVQRPIERVDGVVIPRLLALGVERQSGLVGVAAAANVELRHKRAVEADQLDVRLLPSWVRKLGPKLAYRTHDRPNALIAVETAPLQAEFDVVCTERATLSEEGWTRELAWQCTVRRGEVFAWRVRVPEGVVPLDVASAAPAAAPPKRPRRKRALAAVLKHWEFDEAARLLKVALTRGVKGQAALTARFTQRVADRDLPMALRALVLEGVRRHTGSLLLQPRIHVALRATRIEGLEARRAAEGQLAFAQEAADWQLDLAAKDIEPVVGVDAVTVLGVRPGQVAVEATLRFAIQKAPVNALTIRLPEGAVNSSVHGADIKSSQLEGRDWTLRLARKVQGRYLLRVTYDHVIPAEGGSCACATIEVPEAAHHEGFVVVARDSDRIEVAIEQPEGLFEVDPADVPRQGAPNLNRPLLAAYRYTTRGSLTTRIDVLGRADVLQARALGAIVETMIKQDGQTVTQLTYDIRNATRQFLRLELPPDAALLGAYVNGKPVPSATEPDGATLVPLLAGARAAGGTRQTDDVLEVIVVYAQRFEPLGRGRELKLASPPVDVRTEALSWAVYLPEGYRAQGTDGNMRLMFRPPADRALSVVLAMFPEERRLVAAAGRWLARYGGAILILLGVAAVVTVGVLLLIHAVAWIQRQAEQARGKPKRAKRRWYLVPAIGTPLLGCLVTLLVVVFLAGMFLPALSRSREEARRIRARNNLNQIAKGMYTYLNEYGGNRFYPATHEQLKLVIPDPGVFIDPTSGKRYVYLHEGKHVRDDFPPNKAMAYMEGAGGVCVAFFDTHVEFYPYGDDRLAALIPNRDFRKPPRITTDEFAAGARASVADGDELAVLERHAGRSVKKSLSDLAQLDEELEAEKLDYGQRKLLDNIRRRQVRPQARAPGLKPKPTRPPAAEQPTPPAKEPQAPAEPDEKPQDQRPPPEGTPVQPTGGVAGDLWKAGATGYASMHRYAPVRGGRQKGALPILFELPSESALPYIFHRPVTGGALGEIELDCRRTGASRPAKGILLVGIVALIALVGLKAARKPVPVAGGSPPRTPKRV